MCGVVCGITVCFFADAVLVNYFYSNQSGEIDFDEFCVMMATKLMEEAGGDISALMGGSKKKQYEEREQRKKDSGAKIMWE